MRPPHFVLAALVAAATLFGLRAAAWHHLVPRAAWQSRFGGPCQGPGAGRVMLPAGR